MKLLLSTLFTMLIIGSAEGSHGQELNELVGLAEQGDLDSQLKIASLYNHGLGVPVDEEEALKWYLKAAEQGDNTGQFNVGVMYEFGLGTSQNTALAREWYQRAADQGNLKAVQSLKILAKGSIEKRAKPASSSANSSDGTLKSALSTAGKIAKFTGRLLIAVGEAHNEQQARSQGTSGGQGSSVSQSSVSQNGYLEDIKPVIGGAVCYYSDGTSTRITGSSNCPRRNPVTPNKGSQSSVSQNGYLEDIKPIVGGAMCYYSDGTSTRITGSSNCPRRN